MTSQIKPKLKIGRQLSEIITFISQNIKSGIIAPTGYGKSLGIPYALTKNNKNVKIMVTVPTANAARSLYQAQLLLSKGSIDVGYATLEVPRYTEKTQIIYATSSYVKKLLLEHVINGVPNRKITFSNVLMVDEIHIGSIDNYLIISLWNYFYRYFESKNIGDGLPRLFISSATLNKDEYPDFNFYEISDDHHEITINYNVKNYDENDILRYRDMATKIIDSHNSGIKGHFLVFAPGKNEIDRIINYLNPVSNTSLIIRAYSGLSKEELEKVYSPSNLRKIIVSTNISETAITIEDISVVFDSMLERKVEGGENPKLNIDFISKSSAVQRCGRTGRTMTGTCYRMITQEKYEELPESRQPEIDRAPLYDIVMSLINVKINPLDILPDKFEIKMRIRDSIPILKELDYINIKNNITPLGTFYQMLNLGIRQSACLYWWLKTGEPIAPGLIIISIINDYGPSYAWFDLSSIDRNVGYVQKQIQLNQYKQKFFGKYIGRSDVNTFVNMWNDMILFINGDLRDREQILKWSVVNSINHKKIRQLISTINHTSRTLVNNGYIKTFEATSFDTEKYVNLIRPIIRYVYSSKELTYTKTRGGTYYSETEDIIYKLNVNMNMNMLIENPPSKLIPFEILGFSEGKTNQIINFSLNIDREHLNQKMTLDATLTGELTSKLPRYSNRRTENIYINNPGILTDISVLDETYEVGPAHPLQLYVKIGKKFLSD